MKSISESNSHLFVVSYESDAERKRVEYLYNNWDNGEIIHPDGLIRITEGVDHDELYQQLATKVPEEQIDSYRLKDTAPEVAPESLTIHKEIQAPQESVESFISYVLSKRKAVLQSSDRNEYEVYSKKGRADVRYTLSTDASTTTVRFYIEGYPPVPSFIAEFFRNELDEFSASQ